MTFTDSYIARCREHPMDREWMLGDFARVTDYLAGTEKTGVAGSVPPWWEASPERYGAFWLPRLDQLLDLLEEATFPDGGWFQIRGDRESGYTVWADHKSAIYEEQGVSREEATYRALITVRETHA